MNEVLIGVEEIQFDGTFYTVPILFYQLWTVFASIGGHVIPCIHFLLTGKQETLYTEVLRKIRELVPQLQPIRGMSDWENIYSILQLQRLVDQLQKLIDQLSMLLKSYNMRILLINCKPSS